MKALVVYHKAEKDLGSLKDILLKRGFTLDFIYGADNKLPSIDSDAHDLAIVLGGSMGVYETAEYPYLLNEALYIKKRIEGNLPILGICLGSQLMAHSMGARVYKGEYGKETGWKEVTMNEDGLKSSVRHLDKSKTKMTQAHQDTFDFPKEGAVLLASSNQYKNQIFSCGEKALGFQCHPEADENVIEVWTNKHGAFFMSEEMTFESVKQNTEKYLPTLKKQTALFMNEWLDEVGLN